MFGTRTFIICGYDIWGLLYFRHPSSMFELLQSLLFIAGQRIPSLCANLIVIRLVAA